MIHLGHQIYLVAQCHMSLKFFILPISDSNKTYLPHITTTYSKTSHDYKMGALFKNHISDGQYIFSLLLITVSMFPHVSSINILK